MKRSLTHDARGLSPIILIVGLVVIVGVAGLVGMQVMKRSNSSLTGTVSNEIAKKIAKADCEYDDKDLCKFFVSWKEHKQYRMTSTTTGEDAGTSVYETDNDKNRMVMSGAFKYEVITQGLTTYTKDFNDGKWWKQTYKETQKTPTDDVELDFEEPKAEEAKDQTTYKKLGTEACGNLTCFKYEVVDPKNTETKEFMWFDNKDYQLRKTRSEGPEGVMEGTFEYNNIKVDIPTDVKELGANQYINPTTGEPVTMPSEADMQQYMQGFGSDE
jgi:Tfp pilus assembly protein PilV